MKIGYFDCSAGISGDMILGALVDAGLSFQSLQKDLSKLRLKGFLLRHSIVKRGGLRGSKVHVKIIAPAKKLRTLPEVKRLIRSSTLSTSIQQKCLKVFEKLAASEAKVHGVKISQVHFHELGAIDTLVDVVGTVTGLERLGIEKIFYSPINTGMGIPEMDPTLPTLGSGAFTSFPAPVTADLLRGVPIFSTRMGMEMATPTGAVLVTTLGSSVQSLPIFSIQSVGYGAGEKNPTSHPNLLRFFLGDSERGFENQPEVLTMLETCIDDLNPQIYEYVMEGLFKKGALDVYLTPIIMKKGRPGTLLNVLCDSAKGAALISLVFQETTTIGIRIHKIDRLSLDREKSVIQTDYGKIPGKKIYQDGNKDRIVPEYEACKKIAQKTGIPLRDIMTLAKANFLKGKK